MINKKQVKRFCKDYTKIENYEEAVNDKTRTWICHHILGELLTSQQLLDHDFYYDVPPCMLKFVTRSEHMRLHNKSRTGKKNPFFGKHHSHETRMKMSESLKGENNPMYGRTGKKNPFFGKRHTEESRKKMSEALKGRIPWNKGKHLSEVAKKQD